MVEYRKTESSTALRGADRALRKGRSVAAGMKVVTSRMSCDYNLVNATCVYAKVVETVT
jgi:hypothetical protein